MNISHVSRKQFESSISVRFYLNVSFVEILYNYNDVLLSVQPDESAF